MPWASTPAAAPETMRLLFDLLIAFLLLGLMEALLKPLARAFMQRRILQVAPLVFSQLDPFMPALLQQCTGAQLEQLVRTKLETLTGESWASDDLSLLFRLYDPRLAADRAAPLPPLIAAAPTAPPPHPAGAVAAQPQA
jgi:hypothetical protein